MLHNDTIHSENHIRVVEILGHYRYHNTFHKKVEFGLLPNLISELSQYYKAVDYG